MSPVAPACRPPAVRRRLATLAAAGCLAWAPAWAGRPLTVDDANTNDAGAGHLEMWVSRAPGATVLNLAPAFAPVDALELALALTRDTSSRINAGTVQLKWRITPSLDAGCNLGSTLGALRTGGGGGHQAFINGLVSCNLDGQGSVHFNLGLVKPGGQGSIRTWGVAYERELGPVTPHVEFFGAQGSRPTGQVGARARLTEAWQLDGTVGRCHGDTLYSLGLKFQF